MHADNFGSAVPVKKTMFYTRVNSRQTKCASCKNNKQYCSNKNAYCKNKIRYSFTPVATNSKSKQYRTNCSQMKTNFTDTCPTKDYTGIFCISMRKVVPLPISEFSTYILP